MRHIGAVRTVARCAVVALVAGLTTALATPAQAAPTIDYADAPSVSSNDFRVGEELVGSIGTWQGQGPISYTLTWQLCNPSWEYPECVERATLTTTDASKTLAYTPSAQDNTRAATAGGDHRVLMFSVTATDENGSGSFEVQRRVRAARLWETPRRSFFARGEPVGGKVKQRGHAAVAMAPDGTTTVIGYDLLASGQYLLGAEQIGTDGDRGVVEEIAAVPAGAVPALVGAATDDTGRVYVSYHEGPGTALQVVERDPATGQWSTPRTLAQHDDIAAFGSLRADGAGHAVVWWVRNQVADVEPEELQIATRAADGTWTTHTVDQPLDDPCEGAARLESIREHLVDIAADGDVTAVWSRRHASCWDTHPATHADTVLAAAYRTGGTWSDTQRIVRVPGFNGYRPADLELSTGGAALLFEYTEFWDPNNSGNTRENLHLLTAGPNGTFPGVDPADPVAAAPATRIHRRSEGISGLGFPRLALNESGHYVAAWEVVVAGGSRYVEASTGSVAGGLDATEVLVEGHRNDIGQPDVVLADDGTAAMVTDLRGMWSLREAGSEEWSAPQTLDLADQQWTLQPRGVVNRAGDMLSIDGDGRLWVAGAIGRDGEFFFVEWNHFGVTRLGPPGGGLHGAIAYAEAPVGRTITLETTDVVSPGGQPVTYAWDLDEDGRFDDGVGGQVETSFSSPGIKAVEVRLTTPDGDRAFASGSVRVAVNGAPYMHSVHRDVLNPVAGSPVTFSAVAHDDFDAELDYIWSVDGNEVEGEQGSTLTRTFTAGEHTVSAKAVDLDGAESDSGSNTFTVAPAPAEPRTLDVESLGAGDGTVESDPAGISCTPDCSEDFDEGTTVTLTAAPAPGSRVDGWQGCDELLLQGTQCRVEMGADRDVSVTFGLVSEPQPQRSLTVVKAGAGQGEVTGEQVSCGTDCKGQYDDRATVTLTAVPARGSVLTGWSGCDATDGSTCEVIMDADRQVTATFAVGTVAVDTQVLAQKLTPKKRKARFEFAGSGGRGALSFQCRLDEAKFKPCSSPKVYRFLTRGKHVFRVRAVDSGGVVDSTPAKVTFRLKRRQ